jgi:hypothetical protein
LLVHHRMNETVAMANAARKQTDGSPPIFAVQSGASQAAIKRVTHPFPSSPRRRGSILADCAVQDGQCQWIPACAGMTDRLPETPPLPPSARRPLPSTSRASLHDPTQQGDGCYATNTSPHPNHPQNCPPTLNVTSLVSSPFCLISAFARSIRKGPNGEFQLTPTPIDTRGRGLLPE